MFAVIFEAFHAALLVAAEDEAHAPLHRKAAFLHGSHRKKRRDGRAFIIHRAAAIDPTVVDLAAKGRVAPAHARRNDIQVAEDTDKLFTLAEFRIAGIAFKILCFKAHFPGKGEGVVKRSADVRSKRCIGRSLRLYARDGNDLLHGFHDRLLMRVKPGVHFRVHVHSSLFSS